MTKYHKLGDFNIETFLKAGREKACNIHLRVIPYEGEGAEVLIIQLTVIARGMLSGPDDLPKTKRCRFWPMLRW